MRLTATFCLTVCASAAFGACAPDKVELKGAFGAAQFTVELADEPSERNLGLMNRPSMPQSRGMLFVYGAPQSAAFWMKNTLIPLDMIFASEEGEILRIHHNAIPLDQTIIDGGPGVLAVLEINGGLAARLGIKVGDVLRHPALDQKIAAWPCE
ncbi:MAG: DUF192 domain-containing protein [Alphaproteobacteria bacterium]|nr:DUF192 domain-containing protein [Alphaproteobacteria bacterium]NNF24512.1 DUF192 domain-containing protein [Paracoccaceae bacterium]